MNAATKTVLTLGGVAVAAWLYIRWRKNAALQYEADVAAINAHSKSSILTEEQQKAAEFEKWKQYWHFDQPGK